MAEECSCMQLIDWKGEFNITEFEQFGERVGMNNWGDSYTVVSAMGPISIENSILLNHLFDTNFGVMDASKGRNQTTGGIWIAKCAGIEPPCTLVMDLEGFIDGRKRIENDTKFEKKSAIFAFALSDIVLFNTWYRDRLGLGVATEATEALLRTVFKAMMMLRICRTRGKVTLMFFLLDHQFAAPPLPELTELILKHVKKIWDSIDSGKGLEEFFDVKVEALCNYKEKEVPFKTQVVWLKKKICGVVGDKKKVVPASGFSKNAQQIWEKIKDDEEKFLFNEDKFLCEEIVKEKFECFKRDYKAKMASGKLFSSLLHTCLSEYDKETLNYYKVVRSEKRNELKAKILQLKTIYISGTSSSVSFSEKREELEPRMRLHTKKRVWDKTRYVATVFSASVCTVGIAIGLGIRGMQVAMIPIVAGAVGTVVALFLRKLLARSTL